MREKTIFGFRFTSIVVQLCFWLTVTVGGAAALAADEAPALVRVPIYFVTDRNLQSKEPAIKFGPHRKYIGDCEHDPFMGSGYCVVANTDKKALTPGLVAQGWAAADAQQKVGDAQISLIAAADFPEIQKKFFKAVEEKGVESEHKNIVLFSHGYKNSFESAWHTAARFSYQFESPVILYSWPSVAKLRSYSSDENNSEWSQEHYNDVLEKLEETCVASSLHLRIYAHSMGSRLAVRATPYLREKPHVVEVALVCPDVDQGLVKHYTRRYLSTKGTVKLRLYMSQRDKALALSQVLHGGYTRLGECADSIASMATSAFKLKDDAKAEAETEEDREFKERIERTKHRMQTIDFTEFDTGMIGHQIPVEVIKSMAFTDAPGPGLELVPQESGQRSRTSRMFTAITKTKQQQHSIVPQENCLRLVKASVGKSRASSPGLSPASSPAEMTDTKENP